MPVNLRPISMAGFKNDPVNGPNINITTPTTHPTTGGTADPGIMYHVDVTEKITNKTMKDPNASMKNAWRLFTTVWGDDNVNEEAEIPVSFHDPIKG